jgi:hypothetical protein
VSCLLGANGEQTVNIEFTSYAFGEIPDTLYVDTPSGERALVFPYHTRGGPYQYHGNANVPFFSRILDESGVVVRGPTLAVAKIPPETEKLLLIFVPVPDGEMKYRVLVFDDRLENFPTGRITLVNFFGSEILAHVGKQDVRVQHAGIERIDVSDWIGRDVDVDETEIGTDGTISTNTTQRVVSAVPVNLFAMVNDQPSKLYSRVMRLSKDKRYIIFVFYNQDTDNPGVVIRTLAERVVE